MHLHHLGTTQRFIAAMRFITYENEYTTALVTSSTPGRPVVLWQQQYLRPSRYIYPLDFLWTSVAVPPTGDRNNLITATTGIRRSPKERPTRGQMIAITHRILQQSLRSALRLH